MSEAKSGDAVKVHYTGKLDNGTVFDSSKEKPPLEFTIGVGQIIPGFEDAVIGMKKGESKNVKIEADKAYGKRRDDLVIKLGKEKIPKDLDPTVGQNLELKQEDGRTLIALVTEITDTDMTLDVNHPLAGKDLNFEIELVEIG
ncbi:MAG: peptidylprolyl isomerase [Spirochaetes bacterium]|nr:peptidylprolyl isomerase [Spirochaetota bacterium]